MEKRRRVRSTYDALELDVVEVVPEKPVKAIVQIVHGMQEHKERYLPFMEFLADHGYLCVAHDHRGHGKSVKDRKDLGYFYDEKAEGIVEDLNDVIKGVRIEYPHLPVFLFGHSMGSLVVRKYLKKYDDHLAGLILSGVVYENPGAKAGLGVVKGLGKVRGTEKTSRFVQKLADGSFDHGLEGTLKNRWLSANEENVRAFNEDPDCGFPFTLNGYQNLLQLVIDVFDEKGWQMKNKKLPILLVAGEEDPVIGGKVNFEHSVQFLKERGYEDTEAILYPMMRHEILNETDKQTVYDDILQFLNEHADRKGKKV